MASGSVEELHLLDEIHSGPRGLSMQDGTTQHSVLDNLSSEMFVKTSVGLARLASTDLAPQNRGFSIIPKTVWDALRGYYGGGPVIPAIICNVLVRPVMTENEVESHLLRGAWVDINPLMLHLSLCSALGIPMATPKETVAYRMETVESFVSRVMSNFVRQSEPQDARDLDLNASDLDLCVAYLNNVYVSHNKHPSAGRALKGGERLHLYDVVRVWALVYDDILHETLEEDTASGAATTVETPSTRYYCFYPTMTAYDKMLLWCVVYLCCSPIVAS